MFDEEELSNLLDRIITYRGQKAELSTSPVKVCNLQQVNCQWKEEFEKNATVFELSVSNNSISLYQIISSKENSSKRSFVQCCSSASCWNRVMRTSEWKESHSYSSGRYSTSKVHQALSESYISQPQ